MYQRTSNSTIFFEVFGLSLFFLSIFEGLRYFLVRYRRYQRHVALAFCSRCVATLHSLIVGVLATYDVFIEPRYDIAGVPLFLTTQTLGAYLAYPTTAAYLIYDLYPQIYHKDMIGGSTEMVVHHLLGIPGLIYAMHSGVCGYFVSQLLCFEISTPFLHLLWYLPHFGVSQSSLAFKLSGACFVLSFFLFRVVGSCYILSSIYHFGEEIKNLGGIAWPFAHWTTLGYTFLNSYWFLRIIQELIKLQKSQSITIGGG